MSAAQVAERLEDIEFLDSTGAGANEAARRVGFTSAEAMEKWLERQGHYDLWLSLKRRDPVGAHHHTTDKRKKRAMTIPSQQIDTIAALISEAQRSTRARTRNRADKASEIIAELRSTIATEREEDQRKEAARKEVERLERELREAKARLRGGTATTLDVDDSVSAADLREWARANDIECPPKGRVPAAVREAYDAAQDVEAAS